jgi:hypothetical protein
MQGAKRDASNPRRMPMRARSRDEHVARRGLSGLAGPSVVRRDAVALADRTRTRVAWRDSHQSRRTGASCCGLWAISSKRAPRGLSRVEEWRMIATGDV